MTDKIADISTAAAAATLSIAGAALFSAPGTPLLAAAAAGALGGLAGNLLTNSTASLGRAFQEKVLDRWGSSPQSHDVREGLNHASAIAMRRVIDSVFAAGRKDADVARWANVIAPFCESASKAISATVSGDKVGDTAIAISAIDQGLQRALEERVLSDMAEQLNIPASELLPEFLAAFRGDGTESRPGWFVIYTNQVRAQLSRDATFERAWQSTVTALLLAMMRSLVDAGSPPLALAEDDLGEPSGLDRFIYTRRWTQLFGREAELARLMDFVDPSKSGSVRFMLIAGAGGRGKSRLALEVCRDAASQFGMHAGFLTRGSAPAKGWQHWVPTLPTLMVIDYAASRAQEVHEILTALTLPGRDLEYPVRVLLLDRETGIESAYTDGHNKSGHQGWTDIVVGGAAPEASAIEAAFAGEFTLSPVDDPWPIMQAVIQTKARAVPTEAQARAALRIVDPTGSPLFAILVADALADGESIHDGDRYRFLLSVIHKSGVLPQEQPLRDLALNNGALATLTRRVTASDLLPLYETLGAMLAPRFRPPDDDMAIVVDAVAQLTGLRDGQCLHGLEPDLLGEVLILSRCQQGDANAPRRSETLRNLCWRISRGLPARQFGQQRQAAYWAEELLRLATSDFPDPMVRSGLLRAPELEDLGALNSWVTLIRGLIRWMLQTGKMDLALELFDDVVVTARTNGRLPSSLGNLRLWIADEIVGFMLEGGQADRALAFSTKELARPADQALEGDYPRHPRVQLAERAIFIALGKGDFVAAMALYREQLVPSASLGLAAPMPPRSLPRHADRIVPAAARAITVAMLKAKQRDMAEGALNATFADLPNAGDMARLIIRAHLSHGDRARAMDLLNHWPAKMVAAKNGEWEADRASAAFAIWHDAAVETGWLRARDLGPDDLIGGWPRYHGRTNKVWLVFFDYDRANVTTEGRATALEAAAQIRREPDFNPERVYRLKVVGRTDTAEAANTDPSLSHRRAEAISDLAIAAGIPAEAVDISGIGSADPLTPTAGNTREPKNRRASIEVLSSPALDGPYSAENATAERWVWLNRFFTEILEAFGTGDEDQPVPVELTRKAARCLQIMRDRVSRQFLDLEGSVPAERIQHWLGNKLSRTSD